MVYGLQRILAFLILIAVLPLIGLIALLNLLLNGRPVFYCAGRLGKNKCSIVIYKFRTMKENASLPEDVLAGQEVKVYGKLRNDPRLNFMGKFLRRFSLDELPQLWNVVRGDMALIGPRPIVLEEDLIYGRYSDILHSIPPGLTGLWQVSGRCLTTYHRRIAINLYYIKHRSLKLDLWIIYKTVWAVLGGKGAF
ncbi:MAG: sugar transferase [Lentisphaeria bacterium]|nr:sugar transferase [Lentisphaeria bacterium]